MTTSYISDQQNNELCLDELKSLSGGNLHVIAGILGTLAADILLDTFTGKGLEEHIVDGARGVKEMIDDAVEEGGATGDCDVVTTGS